MKIGLLILKNIFLLLFIIYGDAYANAEIYTGENKSQSYFGPNDPAVIKNRDEMKFKDDIFYERFIEQYLSEDFFEIIRFYQDEISVNSSCPDFYFKKNSDYMRYLFRLLTLSYLYESIQKSHYTLYSLGGNVEKCPRDFSELLKSCRPETGDMKMFVKRGLYFFKRKVYTQKYNKMDKGSRERWLSTFLFRKNSQISSARIQNWCAHEKVNCQKLELKTARKALINSCKEDFKLVSLICNETDRLFGINSSDLALDLLLKSHSKKIINKGGFANKCLERFKLTFKYKKMDYYQIKGIFSVVSDVLKKNTSAYLQGELFLPGSLREFDDLGLKDFIYKKEKVIVKVAKKKVIKKVKAKFIPIRMITPKPIRVKKRTATPVPKPVIKKVEIKKISYFEKMYRSYLLNPHEKQSLDVQKYKKDYTFKKEFIKKMEGPLKIYKTRVALKDMLVYDKLGSLETPLQISFVKYLIDFDQHQGLFNIVAILGNRFYIKNDLENKEKSIFIELRNDETSGYRWQISFATNILPIKKHSLKEIDH